MSEWVSVSVHEWWRNWINEQVGEWVCLVLVHRPRAIVMFPLHCKLQTTPSACTPLVDFSFQWGAPFRSSREQDSRFLLLRGSRYKSRLMRAWRYVPCFKGISESRIRPCVYTNVQITARGYRPMWKSNLSRQFPANRAGTESAVWILMCVTSLSHAEKRRWAESGATLFLVKKYFQLNPLYH